MGIYRDDLTGKTFGKWTVLQQTGTYTERKCKWLCRCECGTVKYVRNNDLKRGLSKSCGCSRIKWGGRSGKSNLVGERFGLLVVLSLDHHDKYNRPVWKCLCDCGNEKTIQGQSLKRKMTNSCGCLHKKLLQERRLENNPLWKGGRYKNYYGYILLNKPTHPNATKAGYVMEHIAIMVEYIGRPLIKGETVHHKNGIHDDNRIENLELWAKPHGSGQRVTDLISFAKEILSRYEPTSLVGT